MSSSPADLLVVVYLTRSTLLHLMSSSNVASEQDYVIFTAPQKQHCYSIENVLTKHAPSGHESTFKGRINIERGGGIGIFSIHIIIFRGMESCVSLFFVLSFSLLSLSSLSCSLLDPAGYEAHCSVSCWHQPSLKE